MKKLFFVMFLMSASAVFLPQVAYAENSVVIDGKGRQMRQSKQSNRKKLVKKTAAVRKAKMARRKAAEEARRLAVARANAFESNLKTQSQINIANDNSIAQDQKVRAAAVNALGNKPGTVVVMEVQTGRIVAMVNQDMAVRDPIKPCSVIKLVTALAALEEKVIDSTGIIPDSRKRKPLKPKLLTLEEALAKSNNGYFSRLGQRVGKDKFIATAKKLGLGSPTGINLPGESAGKLPYSTDSANMYWKGDGTEVTAIQLAVMVSTIVNGGKKVVPVIPASATAPTVTVSNPVNLPIDTLKGMIPGMLGSAVYGTAKVFARTNPTLGAAAKTGTCIDRSGAINTDIGLNASVAPIGNPKYAVVVITHGRGLKGRVASVIASEVYKTLIPPPVIPLKPLGEAETKTLAVK